MQTTLGSGFVSWFSGEMLTGGQTVTRNYTLSESPVFVRSGSIIPMRTDNFGRNTCTISCCLRLQVWCFFFPILRTYWISSADTKKSQGHGIRWWCTNVWLWITSSCSDDCDYCNDVTHLHAGERQSSMKMMVERPSIWTGTIPGQFLHSSPLCEFYI